MQYKKCLFKNESLRCEMNAIRSRNHKLTVDRINKIEINRFDDKRYNCDEVNTHAFGHFMDRKL